MVSRLEEDFPKVSRGDASWQLYLKVTDQINNWQIQECRTGSIFDRGKKYNV